MPNPENLIGKGFDKNPQNINRSGANRKSFATVNRELKKKGIKPVSKKELIDAYSYIFNATEEELKEISIDKTVPYAFRLIIGELNNTKTRSKALADLREFVFGKATQPIEGEITVKAKVLTKEQIAEAFKKLEDDY